MYGDVSLHLSPTSILPNSSITLQKRSMSYPKVLRQTQGKRLKLSIIFCLSILTPCSNCWEKLVTCNDILEHQSEGQHIPEGLSQVCTQRQQLSTKQVKSQAITTTVCHQTPLLNFSQFYLISGHQHEYDFPASDICQFSVQH